MTLTPWQRVLQARRQRAFNQAAARMAQQIARPRYVIPQTPPQRAVDDWYDYDLSGDQMRIDANDEELEKWDDFVQELKRRKK